jgi:hypothetical protein
MSRMDEPLGNDGNDAMLDDDEHKRHRDDARVQMTVQSVKDMLMRADEMGEGTYSSYDLVGYLLEEMIRDGACAACLTEILGSVVQELGVDPEVHRQEDDASVFH